MPVEISYVQQLGECEEDAIAWVRSMLIPIYCKMHNPEPSWLNCRTTWKGRL